MGYLWITQFAATATDNAGRAANVPQWPALSSKRIEIGVDSVSSEPFVNGVRFIEIRADDDCCIEIAKKPKADPERSFTAAGERLTYGVNPGDRIAVIASE